MPVAALLAAALALLGCAAPVAGAPARAPNVLLILVDDLGVEAIGCYGGASHPTPNVDRLARSGMRFTQAHTSPLCTPTRVRLLTGRGAARSYAGFSILHPDERTFAHELADAGYATAAAGKWQLLGAEHYGDQAGAGTHPRDAGFDTWCLWQVERLGSRYADPLVDRNGELRELSGRYGPDVFCGFLLDFARTHREEPFLAFYPMVLTHEPFEPTPASVDGAGSDARNFADMVAYADALVGRLIDGLEELGLRDDTLVIFTADNGSPRSVVSRAGGREVRGGKGRTTDAGTHVPLVVSWPGVVPAGTTFDGLVDLYDLAPTILDACGVAPPTDRAIDGRSLGRELRGEPGPARDLLTCFYDPRPGREGWPRRIWARGPRYKLYADGGLFDLVDDPAEERPLDAAALDADAARERERLQAALDALPPAARIAG